MSSLCWACKKVWDLEKTLKQADASYDILVKENEALLLRADRFEAENKELEGKYEKLFLNFAEQGTECGKLKKENSKLKAEIEKYKDNEERQEVCFDDCSTCEVKCRAWQNGFNAKGGNMSFDSVQMLHRIVEEVTPDWYDNNCINCAWFNNLKGVGGYCAYHDNKTTAKGGCNKWAKESDTE